MFICHFSDKIVIVFEIQCLQVENRKVFELLRFFLTVSNGSQLLSLLTPKKNVIFVTCTIKKYRVHTKFVIPGSRQSQFTVVHSRPLI